MTICLEAIKLRAEKAQLQPGADKAFAFGALLASASDVPMLVAAVEDLELELAHAMNREWDLLYLVDRADLRQAVPALEDDRLTVQEVMCRHPDVRDVGKLMWLVLHHTRGKGNPALFRRLIYEALEASHGTH